MPELPVSRTLTQWWRRSSRLPCGRWLFSRILCFMVPYSGSINACIEELSPGHCIVRLHERRKIRNHLGSVHAMALANLGELSTGLALLNGLPENARGILTKFEIEYLKKARGELIAECHCLLPLNNAEKNYCVEAMIADQHGDHVAEVKAHWQVGPVQT